MNFTYNFLILSRNIQKIILNELIKCSTGKLQLIDKDLKGRHYADKQVYKSLLKFFHSQHLPANVYIESSPPILCENSPEFCIFIDPIDGSLNRDLNVGDPGIVIVYASCTIPRFQDVFSGYVYGMRSGDTYYSRYNKSYYLKRNFSKPSEIVCDKTITCLKDAVLYYNNGYGQEFARHTFFKAGILPFLVKHCNAFDNAALEICQICRGAAHLRVEARSYYSKGKLKGSDHANILAAFAIGKPAGLLVTDLSGNSLDDVIIDLDAVQDFICASHEDLLSETIDILNNNQKLLYKLILSEKQSSRLELDKTA